MPEQKIFFVDDEEPHRSTFLYAMDGSIPFGVSIEAYPSADAFVNGVLTYFSSDPDNKSALAFVDLAMPGLDGASAIEEIKKSPCYDKKRMSIYIISASDEAPEYETRLGVGLIRKPYSFTDVYDIINDWLNAGTTA